MTRYALAALLALPACFNPTSGDYLIEEGESSSDCPETDTGGDTGETENEPVAVAVNDDKTTMVIGEGDGAYDCTLDGKNFTCPFDPIEFDMTSYGYDAVSTTTFDISGSWTSSTSFDLTTAFETACEGADCESMGLVSCSGTATGTANLQE